MNKVESIRKIEPRHVAEKLDAVANFLLPEIEKQLSENPRLAEALWFLAWVSQPENYPGGLTRFTEGFIADCREQIGPSALLEHRGKKLTVSDVETILQSFPTSVFKGFQGEDLPDSIFAPADEEDRPTTKRDEAKKRAERDRFMHGIVFTDLHDECVVAAAAHLAGYFHAVCIESETGFAGREVHASIYVANRDSWYNSLWYFPKLWECLFAWLDLRAEKIRRTIAETSVTREVFRWLSLAEETKKGVMIIGNSRYGKTEAIRAYAKMFPWRVRVIETPHSASERDLLHEIARALGISFHPTSTPSHVLRASIDFVLRQSRMMLVFDEAQFLFPSNGRRSDPPRLNYIRREIMDLGLPVIFVCTPQSWKQVEKNYLKSTGYSIEQFEGRLLRSPVVLPDSLAKEELIEVARIHFPELEDAYLEYVARFVGGFGGSLLSCFENVSCLARITAREAGREKLTISDIKEALAIVLPGAVSQPAPVKKPEKAEPVQEPFKRAATPVQTHGHTRSIRPAVAAELAAAD